MEPQAYLIGKGRTADVRAWDNTRVLKLYFGPWRETAEHEAAIGRIAYAAGVPTPRVDEVIEVDGRYGIVFERIDGPTMLNVMFSQPWRLQRLAQDFAQLHHAIHSARIPELRSAKAVLAWGIAQAADLTERQRRALTHRLDHLDDGDRLCHGDYHPDQVLITAQGLRVIDWNNGIRGDPALDVARSLLMLRYSPAPPGLRLSITRRAALGLVRKVFTRIYISHYLHCSGMRYSEVDAWLPIIAAHRLTEHIPGEREILLKLIERV